MQSDVHSVLRQPPYLQTSPGLALDGAASEQSSNFSSTTNPPRARAGVSHSRDGSVTRGRPLQGPTQSNGMPPAAAQRNNSAQGAGQDAATYGRGGVGQIDTGLQRRPSNSYGHHRQTSVIHGLQHSRNPSFNSPHTASPLSPESLHNAQVRNAATMRRAQGTPVDGYMPFMSPVTPESGHSQTQSIDSALGSSDQSLYDGASTFARRKAATARTRKGHGYGSSLGQQGELRTPGEYALHHLFNSFVVKADHKINQCLSNLDALVTPVEQVCGRGADAAFDQLISALGHVARSEPKPLVDSLMLWRKAKGDAASTYKKQLYQHRLKNSSSSSIPAALPRRHTEPLNADPTSPQAFPSTNPLPADDPSSEDYLQADRRATVSVYILCRVLVEIFEQSSLSLITPELAIKLEDIVFTQLRDVEPAQILNSSLRLANWRIYGELLGQMSMLDFVHVTNRFLHQLDVWQQEIARSTGTVGARDLESRVELLLHSMRSLHLSLEQNMVYPTCDLLKNLAMLFVDSHGPTIKQSYCHTFEKLLLQVADQPERVQVSARFKEFSDIINSRLVQMLSKVRHWSSAQPLSILLLCLSPIETFTLQWFSTVTNLSQKLKDKSTRTPAMRAICHLLWTYLHRCSEPINSKLRKVEDVVRMTIPPGKKSHITTEASTAEALVYFVRIVGYTFPDLCFRNVIFPLLSHESFSQTKELRIEQMEPEKMVIGIRSFLAVISDLEKGSTVRPPFPVFSVATPSPEIMPTSPNPSRTPISNEIMPPTNRSPQQVSSTPVNVSNLDDQARDSYLRFCEILGKITILCDQTFGSSAALNEKFAASPNVYTPKTPLVDAFTLAKKEEGLLSDHKQSYYDLLHVAIQALPRCFSDHIPLNTLINLLCTGSAHTQVQIASSAAVSLKAIARQGHAQAVATAFPRFIFQYDSQYSTMSDEGRLGPAHIQTTLTLYLELLQIWTEQLKQKAKTSLADSKDRGILGSSRAVQLEMTNTVSLVDEMEAYGLFFLCSQSRRVREFAIKVLRLVIVFDEILAKEEPSRVIRILESKSAQILDLDNNELSVAERSRLQKDKRRAGGQNILIEICSSEVTYDSTLWFKGFPNLIRHVFEMCPNAVALSRVVVCDRLALMQPDVEKLASGQALTQDFRLPGRSAATPVEVLFDQWKLYLVTACVTLSSPGAQSQSQLANAVHVRKTSNRVGNMLEKLSSARALFSAVIPMLGAGIDAIRNAVVVALGSINRKLYRTLLESLQYAVVTCNDEAKARIVSHQRTPSSPQRSQMTERMRTEVTHIYKLTASFLRHDDVLEDDWILNNLINYARDLRLFLSDADVQSDWRFLKIRIYYCGLIEELYGNISRCPVPGRWMPFESRKSAFTLMEEWCGFAPEQGMNGRRDNASEPNVVQPRDLGERVNQNANLEKEKSNLRFAALSAMAALCAGPVSIVTETNTVLQFNLSRIVSWIDSIFATTNDKIHSIGQRALQLLLLHNTDHPLIIEHAIQQCYGAKTARALESYFSVVTDVLIQKPEYPIAVTRTLGAVIFTLGNENREIRMKSARLLRILDDRQQKSSNLQEFDISISDRTKAVYKLAQFEYSKRLAQAHPELGFAIVSEFSLQFRRVSTDHQRNMVAAILPWLQMLQLQVDASTNGPTPASYMLLSNMLEITVRFSSALHNEVQALWQALATGPHAGNVQLVLDFVINLSLERREQNFVEYAKQIVVYLSTTLAGSKVLEFLMMQLVPKNMINEKKNMDKNKPDVSGLPYVADLSTVLPMGNKQAALSLGQVALIFLVDLMIPPISLKKEDAIRLVHAVMILWDHYTLSVQEQAREMLVHLIHVLVTTKVDETAFRIKRHQVEEVVEAIRGSDSTVVWTYEEQTAKDESDATGNRVPTSMTYLAQRIVEIFNLAYDNFTDLWAKEALHWASICPVRHLACRSFQVFRCISATLDSRMLSDMLARLSNTIADEQADYQTFSLEILTTLKVIIGALDVRGLLKYPQLFWTTCACLNTIHEREFYESLGMLEQLFAQIDLSDPQVVTILTKAKPGKWEGSFGGLQPLVYKGLKSADCLDRTLSVLYQFANLPDNNLVGTDRRLLFNILANFPRFLQSFDHETDLDAFTHAQRLLGVSQAEGLTSIVLCLNRYVSHQYSTSKQLLSDLVSAIGSTYFPEYDAKSLIFMMGLLTNQTAWFREKVMDILCVMIPLVNMRNSEITSHGPDLISPLLRLLQTEHCAHALAVMDHIMEVSCTPMDKHHLRMSMASGSSRAIRKEYERTQSLYGIPMPSGWSIPIPAIYSNMTRNNVHAVFYTCGDFDKMGEGQAQTPEVEFHADDGYQESYFPTQSRADTIRTLEVTTDVNMGDIVSSLDSLDDFFDEPDSESTPTVADHDSVPAYFTSNMNEHGTDVYDEHTAPILSRSLARTSSSLSFQNGLAESRPSTALNHRQQPSYSSGGGSLQTSFSSIDELSGPGPSMTESRKMSQAPVPPITTSVPVRPGLHARSITSPANQFPISHPTSAGFVPSLPTVSSLQSPGEGSYLYHDDAFSDSENSPFPALTQTLSHPTNNASLPSVMSGPGPSLHSPNAVITPTSAYDPSTGGGSKFSRGIRRLTGGKVESAREREKRMRALSSSANQAAAAGMVPGLMNASTMSSQSPKVPRVPQEYLNNNNNNNNNPMSPDI